MTLPERLLQSLVRLLKPKDVFMVHRVYAGQIETFISHGNDAYDAINSFLELVSTFDPGYRGHVVLFKNKLQNEVIRVNL
jgi:hypothetical protein